MKKTLLITIVLSIVICCFSSTVFGATTAVAEIETKSKFDSPYNVPFAWVPTSCSCYKNTPTLKAASYEGSAYLYVNSDEEIVLGSVKNKWIKIDGKKYYITNGKSASAVKYDINGKSRAVIEVCYAKNCVLNIGADSDSMSTYQFDSNGVATKLKGVATVEGSASSSYKDFFENAKIYKNRENFDENEGGWYEENGKYYYYNETGYQYLVNGYAIIADGDKTYALYKFDSSGISSDTDFSGLTLEKLEKAKVDISPIKEATVKTDTVLKNKIDSGSGGIEDIPIYFEYGWKDVYFYTTDSTYLANGYAIVPWNTAKTQYHLCRFNNKGKYEDTGISGSSPDAVLDKLSSNKSYEPAEELDDEYGSAADDGDGVTVDQLPMYDNDGLWTQVGSKWRYGSNDEYLAGGYAIIKWGSSYGLYKFNTSGYYESQYGSSVTDAVKSSLLRQCGQSKFGEATMEYFGEEDDEDEDEEDDEESPKQSSKKSKSDEDEDEKDDEDDKVEYDNTYLDSKGNIKIGEKAVSDAEFLRMINAVPEKASFVVSNRPTGAYVYEDEKEESDEDEKEETSINKMKRYEYNWDNNTYKLYTDDSKEYYVADGYALCVWSKTPRTYAFVKFNKDGIANAVPEATNKVSWELLIESLSEDSYVEAKPVKEETKKTEKLLEQEAKSNIIEVAGQAIVKNLADTEYKKDGKLYTSSTYKQVYVNGYVVYRDENKMYHLYKCSANGGLTLLSGESGFSTKTELQNKMGDDKYDKADKMKVSEKE